MNVLTDIQQRIIDDLPAEHDPKVYRVMVDLKRAGERKASRVHTTYVRASSRDRAGMIGRLTVKNLYGPIYRKKGYKIGWWHARLEYPEVASV